MRRTMEESGTNNRREFFESIGFDPSCVARSEQVHGNNVRFVEIAGNYPSTDAMVTTRQHLLLTISVADCVPVLLFDNKSGASAAIHAGWRGTEKRIVSHTLDYMTKEIHCNLEDVLAFVGPCAGVCCYEVGDEVVRNFPEEFSVWKGESGKYNLDLKRLNFTQLIEGGVPEDNIEISPACTIHDENFHSFRRDGTASGRMLAVIGLK